MLPGGGAPRAASPDTEALIALARTAGGAYAADALFDLAPRLRGEARADLLREAFVHAERADEAFPKIEVYAPLDSLGPM
jgi:hypothetical protein